MKVNTISTRKGNAAFASKKKGKWRLKKRSPITVGEDFTSLEGKGQAVAFAGRKKGLCETRGWGKTAILLAIPPREGEKGYFSRTEGKS